MNAYMISNDEIDKEKILKSIAKYALFDIMPLAPFGWTASSMKKIYQLATTTRLTIRDMDRYINSSNAEWKENVVYIEHPRRNKVLIPINEYKEYILREMVSDIANYIQDNLRVSKLTIGIVASFNAGLGANISVKEINADAKIKCKLAKDYLVNYEESTKTISRHKYIWIDKFPDIKTAVEHKNKKFEVVKDSTLDFGIKANIMEKAGIDGLGGKKYKFYISYQL